MSEQMNRVAYALRREGVQIVASQDGRFPRMVILNPSHRLMQKAVQMTTYKNGVRTVRNMATEQGVTVYW
ncbi:hypothetical protein BKG95_10330 [Rodentibacter pneumotropicus]|uniref:Uncharacterized protein n=1 Tax=Rodentibacter pneumotropicus TaxID=758 RepID=A0AAW5LCY5_9PAST|nr:hypothetical protein [Rodentibacter pneumotropicus]MCQ9121287.1 hypothetical protein [Rodentibacter pneumotropicus]OOF66596.1 hypothetical protein BKG95_10330 [Rodentibacter pneumotropicus]